VDNVEDGLAVDLRTPFVDGKPVVVFIKRRPVEDRFANHNADVAMVEPREVFSEDEIARLGVFCRAMGLDWGGLDILRDRPSGRLYVVDVNKTDMGPPIALPFPAKLKAVARMGRALRALITEQAP
jgi:glutathione synthase/RimK-type ligase-like ATP-grasp enzyme